MIKSGFFGGVRFTRLVSLTVLAVVLSSCSFAGFNPPTPEPGSILFQDAFTDTSTGWLSLREQTLMMDYDSGGFRFYLNRVNYDAWSIPRLYFREAVIEADAGRLGGPGNNLYGLVCAYKNKDNFLAFVISSDGYYGISQHKEGVQSLLGNSEMKTDDAIFRDERANHLKAECTNHRLALTVNGKMLLEVVWDGKAQGDVGLLVGSFDTIGVDILFKNFVVKSP
jgi:hypothetical protein